MDYSNNLKQKTVSEIIKIFSDTKEFHVKKGLPVLQAGDETSYLYYLQSGYIRSCATSTDGWSCTLNIYTPGSIFPLSHIYAELPSCRYEFISMSPCVLRKKDSAQSMRIINSNTDILLACIHMMASRVEGLSERLHLLMGADAKQKVSIAFILLAQKFGIILPNNTIDIRFSHTHQDIADIAGVSRETATKILLQFERSNIIHNEQKFTHIKQINQLYALAGMSYEKDSIAIL